MSGTLSDDINDYCFIDTETKALPHTAGTVDENVTTCGAYRYSENAVPIMVQFAVGDEPVSVSAFPDFDPTRRFVWAYGFMPEKLIRFHERALRGEAWYVGWNMQFDRLMLNRIPHCTVRPDMTIDAMGQAAASNLPGKLEGASRVIGRHGKQQDGKELIKLFTTADWTSATPQTHPEEWARFKSYGGFDIVELRAVFKHTRPLPRREWQEYWVSEKINDRGMLIDVDFAERAAAIAALNREQLNQQIAALTGSTIDKVTQRERVADWLYDHCANAEAREHLVTHWVEDDEIVGEEDILVPGKLSVAEEPLTAYINYFETLDEEQGLTDDEYELLQIAEARLIGASATPAKFQKALDQRSADDALRGQYRWNGAQQTGRFSSQGVQVHNLIRAALTDKEHPTRELDVIELINSLESY
jgi:hypothetical protein